MTLSGKRVLLIVSGGIAAYKSLELVRLLRGQGCGVTCVLTTAGVYPAEGSQRVPDSRSVFRVQRPDVVVALAQHIEPAFQAIPAQGGEPGTEGPGLTNHSVHFQRIRIKHGLVRKTHQKPSWNCVPKHVTGFDNVTSPQFHEPRQDTSWSSCARASFYR